MSEVLAYSAKKNHKEGNLLSKILWIIVGIVVLAMVCEIIFRLFIVPKMIIKKIVIESDIVLSQKEVLAAAGIQGDEYYFNLDTDLIRNNLEAHPLIKEASADRVFFDTLEINLKGRKPIALSFAQIDEKTIPLAMDEDGIIFQIGQSITNWDLPIISGIKYRDVRIGIKMPRMLVSVLTDLKNLKTKAPELFAVISEIQIVPRNSIDFDLILYPMMYNVKVRLKSSLDVEMIEYTLIMLDMLEKQNVLQQLTEIDLRTGEVVFTQGKE